MLFSGYKIPGNILVNRVDAMGDVILALPVCGLIKRYYPECKVTFLGRTYTSSIAKCSIHVDEFMNRDEWNNMNAEEISTSLSARQFDTVIHLLPAKDVLKICRNAKIKVRIGGMNKPIYWKCCNRIVPFSRKRSRLSEAQLNMKLLKAVNINELPLRNEVYNYYGFSKIPLLKTELKNLLHPGKFNLILHPLSNKNAKEWGLHNFSALIKIIDQTKFNIFITGSQSEKETLTSWLKLHNGLITDLTGKLDTDQLIAFIKACDGLVASSTGPVHIAAATGINTLGLYENKWTKRGERWGPIGKKAGFLECINDDMDTITVEMVYDKIRDWK